MTITSPAFVLVPGAWQGGWAWQPVARRLREAGCAAVTVTLPGLADGNERAGLRLSDAVDHVVAEVSRRDLSEVVLVGQSWGGYVITGAAHGLAGRLAKVIYYNAIVPARGTAMVDENAEYAAMIRAAIEASSDGTISVVREQVPVLMPEAGKRPRTCSSSCSSRSRAVTSSTRSTSATSPPWEYRPGTSSARTTGPWPGRAPSLPPGSA
jgi:pimeloyl-ACP methyl ester carboxylesterase